jgi:hypothetical protein
VFVRNLVAAGTKAEEVADYEQSGHQGRQEDEAGGKETGRKGRCGGVVGVVAKPLCLGLGRGRQRQGL